MGRFATRRQKDLLFYLQDGLCSVCREPLGDDYEADHIIPYSENGETKTCNLQLLCNVCHSAKTRGQDSGRSSTPFSGAEAST